MKQKWQPCNRWLLSVVTVTMILAAVLSASAVPRTWDGGGSDSNWFTAANWSPDGVPAVGDDITLAGVFNVMLTNATEVLQSFSMTNASLVFANYPTNGSISLTASNVTIQAGSTITHMNNTALSTNALGQWVPDGCVYIVCTNFTLQSGGQINANAKGYAGSSNGPPSTWYAGYGPGRGGLNGGGGYGGYGGAHGGTYGLTYGSVDAPVDPGSGAGDSSAQGDHSNGGGNGGGLIRIASYGGAVVVNGTITANGGGGYGAYGSGGSGGGIYITCRTFAGSNGIIRADGGGRGNYDAYSSGGGGRIAVIYSDPVEQAAVNPKPTVTFSAAPVTGNSSINSEPGTIYLPDTTFYPIETLAASASIAIPNFTNWAPASLTISNAWIRFPFVSKITVTNNVTLWGALSRLDLANNPVFTCGGDMVMTNGARLYVYAGATNGNGAVPDYGALVSVGGSMVVATNCWIYPVSDSTNGGSVLFRVRDLNVLTQNAGFMADFAGFAGGQSGLNGGKGYGPGASVQGIYSGGAGYGGAGGKSSGPDGGPTYGSSNAPVLPGSGSANDTGSGGGGAAGGGLVRIEASGSVVLSGTVTANGKTGQGNYAGGGSGGGIYIRCREFTGANGVLSAKGGNYGNYAAGGGGGGGRIAIWRVVDRYQGVISNNVSGGIGVSNGWSGTVYWGWVPPPGTMISIR